MSEKTIPGWPRQAVNGSPGGRLSALLAAIIVVQVALMMATLLLIVQSLDVMVCLLQGDVSLLSLPLGMTGLALPEGLTPPLFSMPSVYCAGQTTSAAAIPVGGAGALYEQMGKRVKALAAYKSASCLKPDDDAAVEGAMRLKEKA